jgi:hypothetical protein
VTIIPAARRTTRLVIAALAAVLAATALSISLTHAATAGTRSPVAAQPAASAGPKPTIVLVHAACSATGTRSTYHPTRCKA